MNSCMCYIYKEVLYIFFPIALSHTQNSAHVDSGCNDILQASFIVDCSKMILGVIGGADPYPLSEIYILQSGFQTRW